VEAADRRSHPSIDSAGRKSPIRFSIAHATLGARR
jgi:hypothetical protein